MLNIKEKLEEARFAIHLDEVIRNGEVEEIYSLNFPRHIDEMAPYGVFCHPITDGRKGSKTRGQQIGVMAMWDDVNNDEEWSIVRSIPIRLATFDKDIAVLKEALKEWAS